ncbi:MAG: hypothetical protein LM573_06915 [Thermofilum sp.]|nr:hypothetical protein [Thermofilum sp.]
MAQASGEARGKVQEKREPREGALLVKIDLRDLYGYGVKTTSEKFLELILEQYEALKYSLLFAASPDIDVFYYDDDFKEFVLENCPSDKDLVECAVSYAGQKGYETVVWLFDGYEEAVAVVRKRGE